MTTPLRGDPASGRSSLAIPSSVAGDETWRRGLAAKTGETALALRQVGLPATITSQAGRGHPETARSDDGTDKDKRLQGKWRRRRRRVPDVNGRALGGGDGASFGRRSASWGWTGSCVACPMSRQGPADVVPGWVGRRGTTQHQATRHRRCDSRDDITWWELDKGEGRKDTR